MKILMKPIEMVAWFTKEGVPHPVRYRIQENKENVTININKVILMQEEKLAGNRMYLYRCQSNINGIEQPFEIKYEISTCKWFLYKI